MLLWSVVVRQEQTRCKLNKLQTPMILITVDLSTISLVTAQLRCQSESKQLIRLIESDSHTRVQTNQSLPQFEFEVTLLQ